MTQRQLHRAAEDRLAKLDYPSGSLKWVAFWDGHMARAKGKSRDACPYPVPTEAELARGKRSPQRRKAWMEGFGPTRVWAVVS